MDINKVLYISQEITPYLPSTPMSEISQKLPQGIQERGSEVRTFMPKYGCIKERRNQLHEVIRLSGMNIIIDDSDHPLIIKVATLQPARMQVYFIDNEDYFLRGQSSKDLEIRLTPEDNDERIMFYVRGVVETVKKLRWMPTVVHCHGWFSALVPVYLKTMFADEPLFRNVKVIVSLYDDAFPDPLDSGLREKIAGESIKSKNLALLDTPSYENLHRFVMNYVDGVAIGSEQVDAPTLEMVRASGKPVLEYQSPAEEDFFDNYMRFYDALHK